MEEHNPPPCLGFHFLPLPPMGGGDVGEKEMEKTDKEDVVKADSSPGVEQSSAVTGAEGRKSP